MILTDVQNDMQKVY